MDRPAGEEPLNFKFLPAGTNPLYTKAQQSHLEQSADEETIGRYFLDALSFEITHYHREGEPCIQDSTILLRSIAYHIGLGNTKLADDFAKLAPHHPKPVLAYLCNPGREVRLRRLEGRIARSNDTPEDYVVRDNPSMFMLMETTLGNLAATHFGMEPLDTSHLEVPEARAKLIADLVQRLKSFPSVI